MSRSLRVVIMRIEGAFVSRKKGIIYYERFELVIGIFG